MSEYSTQRAIKSLLKTPAGARAVTQPLSSVFLQGAVSSSLTCLQLHKRAERVAALLMERGGLQEGDHVALVYPPGGARRLLVPLKRWCAGVNGCFEPLPQVST